MKAISNIITNSQLSKNAEQGSQSTQQDEYSYKSRTDSLLSKDEIAYLWLIMSRMYGHRWTSSQGEEIDEHNVWLAGLKGIPFGMIKTALNLLIDSEYFWPPSVVEFRSLCKKAAREQSGIKSAEEAYSDFCKWHVKPNRRPQELNLITWNAYQELDSFALAHANTGEHKRIFKDAYEIVENRVNNGEELKQYPPELEKIERQPMEQSEAIKQVESLKGLL